MIQANKCPLLYKLASTVLPDNLPKNNPKKETH
jgi:hypothetical protein